MSKSAKNLKDKTNDSVIKLQIEKSNKTTGPIKEQMRGTIVIYNKPYKESQYYQCGDLGI